MKMNEDLFKTPIDDTRAQISGQFAPENTATLFEGDCLELLKTMPDNSAQLVITSPPYNIGKEYEKRAGLSIYLEQQESVIDECIRILADGGSLCWQVGNYIENGEVFPLDILFYPIIKKFGLKLRNRVVWTIGHGLHATNRLSGRHEAVLWFTKGDDYRFNLDPIRVPQKYPGKRAVGGGEYTGNPLGKNPSDVWDIPNVKNNHIEKTPHPAQYPIELVERFVLSTTVPGDLVFDPYMGSGTTGCAGLLHGRRVAGAELMPDYIEIAKKRWTESMLGTLRRREFMKPVYQPKPGSKLTVRAEKEEIPEEPPLFTE